MASDDLTGKFAVAKKKIDGVLLLDKPVGISSNAALQKARWLLCAEKGGHTGALDPFASGLLPLCFGEATKFAQRMLEADKAYCATIQLGAVSTTLDGEGEITWKTKESACTLSEVKAVLDSLTGSQLQCPPMYSALKFKGKPLYQYARQGIEIARSARCIQVYKMELVRFVDTVIVIHVSCSKGTYIRVLADEIGRRLGCGAYLSGLRRTQTGSFKLDDAFSLGHFDLLMPNERISCLLPTDILLQDLPKLDLKEAEFERIRHGMHVSYEGAGAYRLYASHKSGDNYQFVGLGEISIGVLKPKRLLAGFE